MNGLSCSLSPYETRLCDEIADFKILEDHPSIGKNRFLTSFVAKMRGEGCDAFLGGDPTPSSDAAVVLRDAKVAECGGAHLGLGPDLHFLDQVLGTVDFAGDPKNKSHIDADRAAVPFPT